MFKDLKAGWNARSYAAQDGSTLLFQLHMPENYDADRRYPMLVFMHGAGSRCDDNSHIFSTYATFLRKFESGEYRDEAIVLAPCCPKTASWVQRRERGQTTFDFTVAPTVCMQAVIELLDAVQDALSVDSSRLYLYGNSMGAAATWELLSRFPERFAAAVPAAGLGDPHFAAEFCNTPIWIFHGDADKTVPYECSVLLHDALLAAGGTNVQFTTLPGAGHNIWPAVSDTDGLFAWIFAQRL